MTIQENSESSGVPATASGVNYTAVSTNTTVTIKTGTGIFFGIVCTNAGTAWTVQVFDNTAASGQALTPNATMTLGAVAGGLPSGIGVNFSTGLTFVTTGTTPGAAYLLWK